jgi:hypothetical protein
MSTFSDDAPPATPLIHQVPRRTDPLELVGLVVTVAGTAYVVALSWSYWDTVSEFASFNDEDGASTIDHLRAVSSIVNPVFIAVIALGVVVAMLRGLLDLLDRSPGAHTARDAARVIGGIAGAAYCIGGVVAAIDVAFIRDDDALSFGAETRWQEALAFLAAALIGAATAWLAVRREKPARDEATYGPVGIWPYVDG